MTTIYSIPVTWEQMHGDEQVGELQTVIHFTVLAPGGDGWNEPRYGAQAELHHVTYERQSVTGDPREDKAMREAVEDWAQDWLADHQDAALEVYHDAMEREREYAAKLRSER